MQHNSRHGRDFVSPGKKTEVEVMGTLKAAFWTSVVLAMISIDIVGQPNDGPLGMGFALFYAATCGPWIASYWLRNRHPAFMWIHRDLYLPGYRRTKRLLGWLLIITLTAAAMEMYRQSNSPNRDRF